MNLFELNEPQLLVVYAGRFQPFHKGHGAVYDYLVGKFGRNNVFIATSNKVELPKSPFSFAEKSYFMQLVGLAADRIIQCDQPYRIESLLDTGRLNIADQNNAVLIFAVSEKDMSENPRFKTWTKKDGSQTYFQPMPDNIKETEDMTKHGYIMTVPTFDFNILGHPMRSGTELRELYVNSDEKSRQTIIKDLFGKYTNEAEQLMTSKLSPQDPIQSPRPTKLPKTAKPVGGLVTETTVLPEYKENINEIGGTGVVKKSKDSRYSMATMGDQNAVTGNTLGDEMKKLGLTGRRSPNIGQRPVKGGIGRGLNKPVSEMRTIEDAKKLFEQMMQEDDAQLYSIIQDLKDQIKPGMPAKYIDSIKQRIERLKSRRSGL